MEGEDIEEAPDVVYLKTPEILYPPKGAANKDYNARSKNIITASLGATVKLIINGSQSLDHLTGEDLGMSIDQTFKKGDKVTSDNPATTGTLLEDADKTGPSMELTDVVGDWSVAKFVYNTETKTSYGPDADAVQFIGSTPDTVSGSVTNWGAATWSVSKNSDMSDPMVTQKAIAPGSNQTLDPLERGEIVLGTSHTILCNRSVFQWIAYCRF